MREEQLSDRKVRSRSLKMRFYNIILFGRKKLVKKRLFVVKKRYGLTVGARSSAQGECVSQWLS